jgi:O-antigen ligase
MKIPLMSTSSSKSSYLLPLAAVILALLSGIGTVFYPLQVFSFILVLVVGFILFINSKFTLIIAAVTLPLSNLQLSLGGISVDLIEPIIVIGLLQLAVSVAVYRKPLWLPPTFILIPAFAMPIMSIGWSQDQATTLAIFPTILKSFLFVLFMFNSLTDERNMLLFVRVYTGVGIVLAIVTLLGPFFPFLTEVTFRGMRVGYLLSSPNEYGDYLLTLLPYSLLALNRKDFMNILQFSLLMGAFVMTLSRGSWLGFGISAIFLLLFGTPLVRQRLVVLGSLGILVLAGLQVGSLLDSNESGSFYRLEERILSVSELSQGELASGSDQYRGLLYSNGLALARQHLWLGMGEGMYQKWLSNFVGRPQNPHSVYLNILNSRGLIGLSLWLFMLGYWFYRLLKRYLASRRQDVMALYIMSAMVGLIAHQVVFDGTTPFYFWTILILGSALTHHNLTFLSEADDPALTANPDSGVSTSTMTNRTATA